MNCKSILLPFFRHRTTPTELAELASPIYSFCREVSTLIRGLERLERAESSICFMQLLIQVSSEVCLSHLLGLVKMSSNIPVHVWRFRQFKSWYVRNQWGVQTSIPTPSPIFQQIPSIKKHQLNLYCLELISTPMGHDLILEEWANIKVTVLKPDLSVIFQLLHSIFLSLLCWYTPYV